MYLNVGNVGFDPKNITSTKKPKVKIKIIFRPKYFKKNPSTLHTLHPYSYFYQNPTYPTLPYIPYIL